MASFAYRFVSDLGLYALHVRLNQLAPPIWKEGDSAWYGDYLGSKPFPGVRWRIHDFGQTIDQAHIFNADVRLDSECRTSRTEIDTAFLNLMARVPARDVHEIENYD